MILQNLIRLHKITQYLFYNLLIVYIKNLEIDRYLYSVNKKSNYKKKNLN